MIPGIAANEIKKEITPENVKKLKDFLAEEFGLNQDADFEGIYPLILALWGSGIPQGIYQFFHDLHVLEKQLQIYMSSLGSDISTAETLLSGPIAVEGMP